MLATGDRSQRIAQWGLTCGSGQLGKRTSQEVALFEAESGPASIGIADDALGIGDQDQALGVTQDLAGEVALALQLSLGMPETADVQQQPAVLENGTVGIAQGKTIDEHVDGRSVLAAQHYLVIAQSLLMLHDLGQLLPLLGREVDGAGNVHLQQFVATGVAQNAHQGVVHFDKTPVRRGEEDAFLDGVEQFAIALLGFAPVGDVLENVHGLHLGAGSGVNA